MGCRVPAQKSLRYLRGSPDEGRLIDGKHPDGLNLKVYTDSAFADDPDTRWSTAGYVVMAPGAPIYAKCSRKKIVRTFMCPCPTISSCLRCICADWDVSASNNSPSGIGRQ